MRKATNIEYETDGAKPRLPSSIAIPNDVEDQHIADYISDETGWLVQSFTIED